MSRVRVRCGPAPRPSARWTAWWLSAAAALFSHTGRATPPEIVDRVAVRFDAAETGGASQPLFIFERELAFEARLEALSDTEHPDRSSPYLERHVRAALERHVAEELLAHLTVEPAPSATDLAARTIEARSVVEHRVGGRASLDAAAAAEGLGAWELEQFVVREARASLYIDRMIAPMFEPSEAELRELSRTAGPFRGRPFDEVSPLLRRLFVAERLDAALQTFFQNVRGRVHIVYLGKG